MDVGPIPSVAAVEFPSAGAAARRVAGVAAAARIVRELAEAGFAAAWVSLPEGETIDAATKADLDRLAGALEVRIGKPPAGEPAAILPFDQLVPARAIPAFLAGIGEAPDAIDLASRRAGAQVLRRTGKAGDGPVSRWLNRPVSRRLSELLLAVPGIRPIHATAGTVAITLAMFAALIGGGAGGLVAGGLLFQAASIFDGVDGEIARATFRSSHAGATLDSLVDVATNALMIVGVTVNLALAGHDRAAVLGAWGLLLFVAGQAAIGWRAARQNAPVGFDTLKHHYRARMAGPLRARLMGFVTVVSSRDFFALLFAALILAGWPIAVLYIFAAAATIWIWFVLASLLVPSDAALAADLG